MSKSSNIPSDFIFDKKFCLFGLTVYRYWKSPTKKRLSILYVPVYSRRISGYTIIRRFLFFRWKTTNRFQKVYDEHHKMFVQLAQLQNSLTAQIQKNALEVAAIKSAMLAASKEEQAAIASVKAELSSVQKNIGELIASQEPQLSGLRISASILERMLKEHIHQSDVASKNVSEKLIEMDNRHHFATVELKSNINVLQKKNEYSFQNIRLLTSMLHGMISSNRTKPCICIVSPNFSSGGLERRINNIVEQFNDKYDFILATFSPKEDMRTKPSPAIKQIISIKDIEKLIHKIDCFDIHPFLDVSTTEFLHLVPQKKIYTLHGYASINNFTELLGVDKIISISKKTSEQFVERFPFIKESVSVDRNTFSDVDMNQHKKDNKNIIFIVTNYSEESKNTMAKIINDIPEDFHITIIGNIDSLNIDNKNVAYLGWANIEEFFNNNEFICGFSRGGFCSIDIISRGIPSLSFYDRDDQIYLTPVTKSNFEEMYNNNFVSYDLYDKKNLHDIIRRIMSGDSDFDVRDEIIANMSPHDYFDI